MAAELVIEASTATLVLRLAKQASLRSAQLALKASRLSWLMA
jgi:hypothetical protein